ncbi:hypothetical protein BD779DRAFT_1709226 [Infundibulicybe gibba]|nr:hypothetical protein BD779DRAFT_1709226 [Infundibulicybe gibba]
MNTVLAALSSSGGRGSMIFPNSRAIQITCFPRRNPPGILLPFTIRSCPFPQISNIHLGFKHKEALPSTHNPEVDDGPPDEGLLRDPNQTGGYKGQSSGLPWRGFLNIGVLLLLTAPLCLFIFFPIFKHFQSIAFHEAINGNLNISGTGRDLCFEMEVALGDEHLAYRCVSSKWSCSKLPMLHEFSCHEELARSKPHLRNSDNSSSTKLAETARVRSFVESAITSALLSVESRMHHRAWQNVASGHGTHYGSFSTLLAQPFTKSISIHDPLTVGMGWLNECMLKVIAIQDVIESSTLDGQKLVNFDKRRLIVKAPSLPSTRRRVQPEELNRRGFERLNNIEKEVLLLQFEHRGIKDEAVREAIQAPVNGNEARKTARPFQ